MTLVTSLECTSCTNITSSFSASRPRSEMATAASEAESCFASAERRATAREEELTERLAQLQEEQSDAVARHAVALERLHTARVSMGQWLLL